MRQRPALRSGPRCGSLQRAPDHLAGLGEGKGVRREGNWERNEGKGNGRGRERKGKEGRGRGEEKGKGRDPTKFPEKLTPLTIGKCPLRLRTARFTHYTHATVI